MKMKRIIFLNIFLAFATVSVSAQSFPSLLVGSDAAGFSIGSATVAGAPGAYSLENNVAGMSFINGRMSAGASFGMWQPSYGNDKVIGASAAVKATKRLAFGAAFKYFAQPSYEITTDSGTASREGSFRPSEFNVTVGGSFAVTSYLSVGLAARMLHSSLATNVSANVFGADLGIYFRMKGLSAGLSVNNLGTKAKFENNSYVQPMMAKLGVGYTRAFDKHALSATAETDILFAGAVMAGAGIEYSFRDLLFVRGGYHYGAPHKAVVPSYGSAGLGVKFFGISLDAAYLFGSEILKNSFCLSLGYEF